MTDIDRIVTEVARLREESSNAFQHGMNSAATIAEAWRSPLRPGSADRLNGHVEATRGIAAAIRAALNQPPEEHHSERAARQWREAQAAFDPSDTTPTDGSDV